MRSFIPEDLKHELNAIRDRGKEDSWRVGDITNALIDFIETAGHPIPRMEVYRQVSVECGVPARTVRYYSRVARFYAPDARAEYDILSFEHFRVATDRQNWRDILDDAVEGIDTNGRPKTVEFIEHKYLYNDGVIPSEFDPVDDDEQMEQVEQVIDQLFNLIKGLKIPNDSKELAQITVVQLRDILREVAHGL